MSDNPVNAEVQCSDGHLDLWSGIKFLHRWYNGNLYTQSINSDGKLSPEENAAWHAKHGYDFLTITHHNRVAVF